MHPDIRAGRGVIRDTILTKMIGVDLNVLLPLFRDVFVTIDRFDRAGRLAGAAIDTFIRMDKKLLGAFEISFILAGMNAINGADINAGRVLRADAGFANYVNSHYAILLQQFSYGINYKCWFSRGQTERLLYRFTSCLQASNRQAERTARGLREQSDNNIKQDRARIFDSRPVGFPSTGFLQTVTEGVLPRCERLPEK